MIRINLLGRVRPKAPAAPVAVESTGRYLVIALAFLAACGYLYYSYVSNSRELDRVNQEISRLNAEKATLLVIKAQVTQFEQQKATLQQRIDVIRALQKSRTGGQELLQMVASTVNKTDELWLTSLDRKGDALNIEGQAASINAVANFITQLKRSGYFATVEIKEAKQVTTGIVPTFTFSMTAAVGSANAEAPPTPPPAGAPKGRG